MYHYLYSLIEGLAAKPEEFERFQYLMPNAIRKVLEIFLAFKIPGSSGLGDKISQVLRKYEALDEGKIRAVEHLCQLESHSDNIGDTTTFSGFSLEQTQSAAVALLEMIGIWTKVTGRIWIDSRKERVRETSASTGMTHSLNAC